ncbi:hypothetical protein ACFXPY_27810 [Streptomyces sp. NPDC059153]
MVHAKWNPRLIPRALGAVTGAALLLGGGSAVQAVGRARHGTDGPPR